MYEILDNSIDDNFLEDNNIHVYTQIFVDASISSSKI